MRFIALLTALVLIAAAATADQISYGDAAIEYTIGMKERKLVAAIEDSGMRTFNYLSPLPLWGGETDTQWSIGHRIEKATENTASYWEGIQIHSLRFYTFDSKLYAVRFETPEKSAAKDFKAMRGSLTEQYGEPESTSWKEESIVSINGLSRKSTSYPRQYSWQTTDNTGIKLTVPMDKGGKKVQGTMTVTLMRTDLDEEIRALDYFDPKRK